LASLPGHIIFGVIIERKHPISKGFLAFFAPGLGHFVLDVSEVVKAILVSYLD